MESILPNLTGIHRRQLPFVMNSDIFAGHDIPGQAKAGGLPNISTGHAGDVPLATRLLFSINPTNISKK